MQRKHVRTIRKEPGIPFSASPSYILFNTDNAQVCELSLFKQSLAGLEQSHAKMQAKYDQEVSELRAKLKQLKEAEADKNFNSESSGMFAPYFECRI
jgi:hypothetical protein